MIEFEKNKVFTLRQKDGNYRVRYTYKPVGGNSTELTYFEWVEEGNLKNPFSQSTLNKLRSIMEKK